MIKSLKDLLDKFSRFTNSLVYDGGICKRLIKNNQFQNILDNTVASCEYSQDETIINFIAFVDGKYILFGISNNSYYVHLSTIFYPSKKQLKNCMQSMKFFSQKDKNSFEEYLRNQN